MATVAAVVGRIDSLVSLTHALRSLRRRSRHSSVKAPAASRPPPRLRARLLATAAAAASAAAATAAPTVAAAAAAANAAGLYSLVAGWPSGLAGLANNLGCDGRHGHGQVEHAARVAGAV